MTDPYKSDINVREATLEQKFTAGLAYQLVLVLCLSLLVLIPVEIWLYNETAENEYNQLKKSARSGVKSFS